MKLHIGVAVLLSFHASSILAADMIGTAGDVPVEDVLVLQSIRGRASVISGDTLWFAQYGMRVRLAGIDACALPQWAFDPSPNQEEAVLPPMPCGPLAKAWLKRAIGNYEVSCRGEFPPRKMEFRGYCSVRGRDLGLEMLRVGWARVAGTLVDARYLGTERYARSARYGLWGTYVLDPQEWQAKAIDRTIARQPPADRNLLGDRSAEFTPPFADWRNRPRRTDR